MQGACLLRVSILRSLQSWSVRISPSLYNKFYVLLLPYCGRIVKNTRQMENFSGCGGCGGCSVNENSFPWIISNSTLIENKYFSWIWCQSHLWQSPLTALVLPMAGAAQPKNFIVKIRNYNTMEPTGQQDWYWLRWGAGGRALTSWFPWSTLTNPASTTTGWRPHLGFSRRSNRNPSICFLTIRLPELFGWKIGNKIYLRW